MIFQDPMTSLNPVMKIGKQITESIRQHLDVDKQVRATSSPRACCARCGIPEPERRLERVPAPALGRHAPARLHRGRARARPEAAVRRRAHDRARRDRAGADARPAGRAAARALHGDGAHHPRPRRRRRARRRDRGDVRRDASSRRRPTSVALPRHADAVHRGAALVDPEARARRATRASPRSPGRPPDLVEPAAGLQVRAALRVRAGPVPRGGAAAPAGRTARPRVPVLVPGRHARGRRGARANRDRRRRRPHAVALTAVSEVPPDGRQRHRAPAGRRTRPCCASSTSSSSSPSDAPASRCTRCPTSASTSSRARPSGSSASRAAASRRPAGRSCSSRRRRRAACSSTASSSRHLHGRRRCGGCAPGMQMIFQDPISSLNPRRKVRDIVARGPRDLGRSATRTSRDAKVDEVLEAVGIDPANGAGSPAARVLRRPVSAHLDRSGARSPSPSSSSATSRSPPSTCRCRPRSSTCSRT